METWSHKSLFGKDPARELNNLSIIRVIKCPGLPLWLRSKVSTYNAGDLGSIPGWLGKIPWRRERLPTPVFWPREAHGLYSSQGQKESDTAERLTSLHF